jgi:UDP-glucuronate 4-epimerase
MKALSHAASMPVLCNSDDESSSSGSSSPSNSDGGNNVHSTMHRSGSAFDFGSCENSETPVMPHVGYKKVLVTGGAGFIGSHVAEFLLARGDDVVIVDEMNDYYDIRIKESNLKLLQASYPEKGRVSIYRGDICDEEFMLNLFEMERPQWVCHMAARAGVRPSIQDPFIYIHSNIKGTTHLMELSHKFGIQNFVFASSSSVYGGSRSCFFSEEENVDNPVSPYAASKKACELLAYTYHHLYDLNTTGLRFFTVYGPRGRPDMAPFKFIDRVSRGVEIQQFGDGSSSRDYTYISDIVDGVVRAIDRQHKYEVFNLGKGSGTSLKDFIDLVQKHTGKKATIKILPDQPGDVPYTCADVSKAYQLLGYKSTINFDEGIRRTTEWYNEAYNKKEISVCPERQANGMGRAPSMVEMDFDLAAIHEKHFAPEHDPAIQA